MSDDWSLADSATLEHLILIPRGGLGNRIRAIGAARRLCSLSDAKLTVVWDFGNYEALFAAGPEVEVLDRLPANADSLRRINVPMWSEGGTRNNRRVPLREDHTLIVQSLFWFCAAEEPLVGEDEALREWLPQPAQAIQDTVTEITSAHFTRTVGMHIRQGDNNRRLVVTPIEDFVREAERVIAEDHTIFLATDSAETEQLMRSRFADHIIVFPKNWEMPFRWPRLAPGGGGTELLAAGEELVPDFVDMQLLAACEYVIGSTISSYSRLAARYNGSPRCLLLPAPPMHPVWGRGLEPERKWRDRAKAAGDPGAERDGQPRIRRNDHSILSAPELGQWEPRLTVSVVIPAYGRQDKLDLTLASLAAQTYPSHLMQVIVVDDGSDPPLRLPEIAPENTTLIPSAPGGWGAGHALNTGVQAADGEVIHRLDADMLLHRDHVEASMRWHHLADYLVVIGYKRFVDYGADPHSPHDVHNAVAAGDADKLFDLDQTHPSWIETVIDATDGLRSADAGAYRVGTGQTISFTHRLWDACGGADTELIRGQDVEFSFRAAQAGAVFVPDPQARAFHLGLSEMLTRTAEGTRFREPYLGNRVPWRRRWRQETGRQWMVPYVDVVVEVGTASYEEARATVVGALASDIPDVRVTLVGRWSELTDERRPPLDDHLLDLRLLHESFVHDARVRLQDSVPPTSAPVPFRFHCSPGWVLNADALRRLVELADSQCDGIVSLAPPRGSGASIGRLERTAAIARARWLAKDGEDLDDIVATAFGTHWIDGTQWALTPAADKPKPASVTALHDQIRTLKTEAARWEKEATRLKRKLQEPLSKKLLEAARRRITRR
ncbi:glycosyltransferase [Actinopolymorpha pittospori]|uniref:GT2 family glycosyltransferase n=1 Tax=Actinopolymorpha pittospori TaxID=648752 RepID=A0A927R6I6_9ACTN|nr:glycosyltransferase [Actinopolymorpha pittospori]MBE1604472.1 GT2 family glycosyltransferase [Actinopolymorpha pittospori]